MQQISSLYIMRCDYVIGISIQIVVPSPPSYETSRIDINSYNALWTAYVDGEKESILHCEEILFQCCKSYLYGLCSLHIPFSNSTILYTGTISALQPVFVSPAGVHALCDEEGECASARACGRVGTLFGLSQHATKSIEHVAEATNGNTNLWYQSYILKDRGMTLRLVRRAANAGYRGQFREREHQCMSLL